jgi:voltage-gated potassium channel Kch
VVTLGDPDDVLRVVETARRNFPNLKILARARNRRHAHLLMEREVTLIVRETFHSAIAMTGLVLGELGISTQASEQILSKFKVSDERQLRESWSFRNDETRLIQGARQLNEELTSLFANDRPETASAQKR